MSNLRAPSATLLRAFLKPRTAPQCFAQSRQASQFMPRHKYAKITRLDKLHRLQRSTQRQEKIDAISRADTLSATFTKSDPSSPPFAFSFTVSRTPSSQLPVYESAKAGGNRHITTIRKLSGDLDSLAAQLRDVLNLKEFVVDKRGNKKANVAINRLTNHIVVRGWRGQEVKAWMEGIGF